MYCFFWGDFSKGVKIKLEMWFEEFEREEENRDGLECWREKFVKKMIFEINAGKQVIV